MRPCFSLHPGGVLCSVCCAQSHLHFLITMAQLIDSPTNTLPPHTACVCRVECCIRCLAQGVHATHIIDGRQPHSLLMELLTDQGVGTMLVG